MPSAPCRFDRPSIDELPREADLTAATYQYEEFKNAMEGWGWSPRSSRARNAATVQISVHMGRNARGTLLTHRL